MSNNKILIMGIGNMLLSDDGFGIHVIKKLKDLQDDHQITDNIDIVDGGAAGIDILYYMENYNTVIFIDSIKGGKEPGYIYKIIIDDMNIFKDIKITSLHDLELTSVLKIAKELNTLPNKIYLIGVEPYDYTTISMELTPLIEKRINEIIDIIKKIIQTLS